MMSTEQDLVLTTQTQRDFHLQSSGVAELIQHVLDAAVAIHIQNGPIMNQVICMFLVPLAYRSAVHLDVSYHQIILVFCVQGLKTPGFYAFAAQLHLVGPRLADALIEEGRAEATHGGRAQKIRRKGGELFEAKLSDNTNSPPVHPSGIGYWLRTDSCNGL